MRAASVLIGIAALALVSWLVVPSVSRLAGAGEPQAAVTNSIGMKFVRVPAGKFTMGSPETETARGDDESQHEVVITKAFLLGQHEVTQGQYEKVMGTNPSFFSAKGGGKKRLNGKNTDDYPVDNVTWTKAVEFCKKLGELPDEKGVRYRLPTEAEWEYACRAGTGTVFHYGNDLDAYKANFCGLIYSAYGKAGAGPFFRRTVRIGDYKPNAFGLYDMHGNVQEWVEDWYDADYYKKSPKEDPRGPDTGSERVLRGGGWPSSGKAVRSAVRNKLPPDEAHYSAGFRVVRDNN